MSTLSRTSSISQFSVTSSAKKPSPVPKPATAAPAGGLQLQLAPVEGAKLMNPLTVSDDVISQNIIGIHDSQAVRLDVESLYNVVNNIVRSSTHMGGSLDLKRAKSIELVEDKVPQNSFMPSYSILKEIACQMTCKPFNTVNAHESVVGILDKLRNYTWDAKAVIALTAFALDFGETWRLSLMRANKKNALELHVFLFGDEDKPSQSTVDLITTLVDRTLQLIDGIVYLEKLIANNAYNNKDVPALYKAPRDLYVYWAILALLASSTQMTGLDWNIKSEVVGKLKIVLTQLTADLDEIKVQIANIEDPSWRLKIFHTPSGILELLKALIFPRDSKQLEIYDNTTLELVKPEVLKTKNLLLFISGLDKIEDEIWALKPIHESLTKDKDKQDYRILWVPVVEEWNEEAKEKFEHLKSLMPWYVVHYFSLIKGIKALREEWNYQGKPIVVVANARGEVVNKNALHMIFVWGIQVFPFRPEDEDRVSLHWNWFWTEVIKINPVIDQWLSEENKYVFIYGGTDTAWTERFGSLLDSIKRDPVMYQTETLIEHLNLAKVEAETASKFWLNITHSILSKIQKGDTELDNILKDIETLLSMKNQKGWALVSKGRNVLKLGYNDSMMSVVEGFGNWRSSVLELQGFDNAFLYYYDGVDKPQQCVHFELNNIRSGVPMTIYCPDPACGLKMDIQRVNYKCCHGIHHDDVAPNGDAHHTPVLKRMWKS